MIGLQQRQNLWHQLWVKPIENKKKLALSKAAIVMADGKLVAASNNFYLDPNEINVSILSVLRLTLSLVSFTLSVLRLTLSLLTIH